jgi:selenocysteine-specific elongation factor
MIVATAGHVDHGKTALVKALTGKDTDTLEEEKRRGLTITSGFAYVDSGPARIGFIDVPGHHQFIHNMLSSIAGIDAVLLVIAADEGVMPQTMEHLRIMDLLSPEQGLLAITKTDRVDDQSLDNLTLEIQSYTKNTFMAGAPIVRTSAKTGSGIEELRKRLARTAAQVRDRSTGGNFRMSIDRAFNLKGVGVVATGTVHTGQVRINDSLMLAPGGLEMRIRGIHSEDQVTTTAVAGHRCAVNLTGVETAQINRGDWLITCDAVTGTSRVDVRIQLPHDATRAIRHWTPVHVFHGATHSTGRLALLENRKIEPGHAGLGQLVLDTPIVAIHGDRCILRNQASDETLAGAVILDVFAPKRGRARPERLERLQRMLTDGPHQSLMAMLSDSSDAGGKEIALEPFRLNWNLTPNEADRLFAESGISVFESDNQLYGVSSDTLGSLREQILLKIDRWHEARPETAGMRLNELYESFDNTISRPLFTAALKLSIDGHEIRQTGSYYYAPGFKARLLVTDSAIWNTISIAIGAAGPRPPTVQELAGITGIDVRTLTTTLKQATHTNQAVQVEPNRFFLRESVDALTELILELASATNDGLVTTAAYRDASGLGRNLAIAVLEYFDSIKLTRRIGNARRIIKSSS